MVLASLFLLLGSIFMRQEGITIAESATGLPVSLWGCLIIDWVMAYPIIAIAAVAIMFSTLLTLMDACPRALTGMVNTLKPQAREKNHSLFLATGLSSANVLSNSYRTVVYAFI